MNYWKHSLLSKRKFGGEAQDYLEIHKFLDSSKLFYFHLKHRALLHHTYGIDLCIRQFGETLTNSHSQTLLIRDIAAEHCKEDLMGVVPTLNDWYQDMESALPELIKPLKPTDTRLREFVLQPLLMSGLKSTLIITHSNFGIYLAKMMLGVDYALELASYLNELNVREPLQHLKLRERWQYAPDIEQLNIIQNEPS